MVPKARNVSSSYEKPHKFYLREFVFHVLARTGFKNLIFIGTLH